MNKKQCYHFGKVFVYLNRTKNIIMIEEIFEVKKIEGKPGKGNFQIIDNRENTVVLEQGYNNNIQHSNDHNKEHDMNVICDLLNLRAIKSLMHAFISISGQSKEFENYMISKDLDPDLMLY